MVQSMISIIKLFFLVAVTIIFEGIDAKPPSRILGGKYGEIGEFPYLASVRINNVHKCGGTIIGSRHILTAAHCFQGVSDKPEKKITVATGTNAALPEAGNIHHIKNVMIYPEYSNKYEDAWVHDIAVIALTKNIVFDKLTKAASLPEINTREDVRCVASGWGDISYPMVLIPSNVRKTKMTTITNEKCQKEHTYLPIQKTHLCAFEALGVGLCYGDSGGPLVSDNVVVGVASFVTPCAVGNPDVFSRVYSYLNFIKKAMKST